MVKIRLKENPSLGSNTYNTGKHNYTFIGTIPEEITDSEDIEFFKNKPEFDVEGFKKEEPKLPKAKDIIPDEEPKEFWTKKQLEDKAKSMSFSKFRTWANDKFKVTGRSVDGIIKDILAVQLGKKKPELK